MDEEFDIVIIGAGMAGASIAAELAPYASVLLAEAEDFPGYHTTGRSAAFWEECYGGPGIVPLTLASGAWLREHGFLHERGALYLGRSDDEDVVRNFMRRFEGSGVTIDKVGPDKMAELVPGLLPAWQHAVSEPACADIDVAGLHQHYLTAAKRADVELRASHRLTHAVREGEQWHLRFEKGQEGRARTLVNAAGAWADPVAQIAGAQPLGIIPYRRTVVQLRVDPPPHPDLPLVLDINGSFYFKPDGERLWLSPHDETPSEACDAAAEELDVAIAIDRLEKVVDWKVKAVERKWAGLRSFAPDRLPVYGYDPQVEGLFWFAGQGGFGIQTAPAAARLGAQVLLGHDADDMTRSIDAASYSPGRFG